jgi:hypothetical protein
MSIYITITTNILDLERSDFTRLVVNEYSTIKDVKKLYLDKVNIDFVSENLSLTFFNTVLENTKKLDFYKITSGMILNVYFKK